MLPQAPGPLAEIVFWQERASILSALSEQLKRPAVKRIMEVMAKSHRGIIKTLEATLSELNKYRVEADENLCFVSTLERHFMVSIMRLACLCKPFYLQNTDQSLLQYFVISP